MYKAGSTLPAEWIMNLVILFFVIFIFFGAFALIRRDEAHVQTQVLADFILVKDASLAAPGQVKIEYALPRGFNLEGDNECKVTLKMSGEKAPKPLASRCALSKDSRVKPLKVIEGVGKYVGVLVG